MFWVFSVQWLQVLLQYGGQEAAEAFEEVGHSDFARPLAQKVGLSAGFCEELWDAWISQDSCLVLKSGL